MAKPKRRSSEDQLLEAQAAEVAAYHAGEKKWIQLVQAHYNTLIQRLTHFISECQRFWEACSRYSKRDFQRSIALHTVAFIVLAIVGLAVKIGFSVFSFILRLPKPGTF